MNFLNKEFYSRQFFIVNLIAILSFCISVFKSAYNIDPWHSSLMFFDAYQMLKGATPFSEIHILYGIITTLIHYFSIFALGNYVLSISVVTGFLYALTFLFYYFILINIGLKKNNSLIIILVIFIIHPVIFLPWSSYIAYFFVILSIFFFTLPSNTNRNFFFLGFFLGLATLSRQTFFFSIILFIFFILIVNFSKVKKIILISSYFSILLLFFIYLHLNSLTDAWIIYSIKHHSVSHYVNFHPAFNLNLNNSFKYFFLILPLLEKLFYSIPKLDYKWFFYLSLLVSNIIFFINLLFKKKTDFNRKLFSISFFSLVLFSEAVHIPHIFRLSTGAIIGIIPLSIYIFKIADWFKKKITLKIKFLLISILIFFFCLHLNYILNLLKTITHYENKRTEPKVSYLKFQRFPTEVSFFYDKFNLEMARLRTLYPEIKYNYNMTSTCMLPIISETRTFQFTCHEASDAFGADEGFKIVHALKPELTLKQKLEDNDKDVVVFQNVIDKTEIFSQNFFIFSQLNYPFENGKTLLILISKNTINK